MPVLNVKTAAELSSPPGQLDIEVKRHCHTRPTSNDNRRYRALLCGLQAVNAIFNEHCKPAIDRTRMDEVNAGIAEYETSLRSDSLPAFTHLQITP